jgi:histidyl-tRNA synthetase
VPEAAPVALKLADAVRAAGGQAIVGGAGRSLKAQMRHADARGAQYVAIIGADELASGVVTLRDLRDHSERRLSIDSVPGAVRDA